MSCSICLCYLSFFFYRQFQISLHLFKDRILIHLLQVMCSYIFSKSSGLSWGLLDTALISCVSLEKGDFWALLCLSLEFIHFSKIWTFFWLIVWFVGHFCMYFISDKDCFIRNFYRLFHWWNNNYYSNSKYGLDQKCPKSTTGFLNLLSFWSM